MEKEFKKESWARVIENSAGGTDENGNLLKPWDVIIVDKVVKASDDREVVYYSLKNGSSYYMEKTDLELIDKCICCEMIKSSLGCICGYKQMIEGKKP